ESKSQNGTPGSPPVAIGTRPSGRFTWQMGWPKGPGRTESGGRSSVAGVGSKYPTTGTAVPNPVGILGRDMQQQPFPGPVGDRYEPAGEALGVGNRRPDL